MTKKIVIIITLLVFNFLHSMDFGALYRQTTKALEEPIPAGQVILVNQDGKEFELPQNIAEQSKTLKEMIEDVGADRKIPLNIISSSTLKEIVDLLKALHKHQNLANKALLDAVEQETRITDSYEFLAVANYLDIPSLITLASRNIAKELASTAKDISKKASEKIVQKVKERKLLESIFHQYYLLTGNKISGFPESVYTLTQQEQTDYPTQNWMTPSFPTKTLSLMAGAALASTLLKPKKEVPGPRYLGVETISLTTEGKAFHVPLEIALGSPVIKEQYQNSLLHTFDFSQISPEGMQETSDLMWALENFKHLKYRQLVDALARHMPTAKKNIPELLHATVVLNFKPAVVLIARVSDAAPLAQFVKDTQKAMMEKAQKANVSLDQKEIKSRISKHPLVSQLAGYYYLFHGQEIPGLNPKDYGLSIQDYLNYSPESLIYPVIERRRGFSPIILESSQHMRISETLYSGTLIHYENSLNLRNLQLNSLEGLSNIPDIENIRYLDLSHNNLSTLGSNHFLKMVNLTRLDLSHNNIEVIDDVNTFNGPLNLEVLNLSDNPLTQFNTAILSKLTKLKTLGWPGKNKYVSYKNMDQLIKQRLKQRKSKL